MLSVPVDRRKLTPFAVLKKNNILQGKLCGAVIFKCDEKELMTGELRVKWLREVRARRLCEKAMLI